MNKTPLIRLEEKKTKVLHCLAELDQIEGVLGEDNGSGWAADRVRIVKQELEALLGRVEMARLEVIDSNQRSTNARKGRTPK